MAAWRGPPEAGDGGRPLRAKAEEGEEDDLGLSDEQLGDGLALCGMLQELGDQGEAPPPGPGRERGAVEKFASKRGFGVVRPDSGGESLFVHWTEIRSDESWPQLTPGMRVEFTRSSDRGKLAATSVTLPGGGAVVTVVEATKSRRKVSPFTLTGTVAWFHRAGYGFIAIGTEMEWPEKLAAGSQIYVSREDLVLAPGSLSSLDKGMQVQFKVWKPQGQTVQAVEVTAVGGEPLAIGDPPGQGSWRAEGQGQAKGKAKGQAKGRDWAGEPEGSREPIPGFLMPGGPLRAAAGQSASRSQQGPGGRQGAFSAFGARRGAWEEEQSLSDHELTQQALEALHEEALQQQAFAEMVEEEIARQERELREEAMTEQAFLLQDQGPPAAFQVRRPFQQGQNHLKRPWQQDGEEQPLQKRMRGGTSAVPCRFFAQGRCSKGVECNFLHAEGEMPLDPLGQAEARASKVPCRFFAEGRCQRGAACGFSHRLDSQAVPLAKKVPLECEFYAKLRCTRGDACPFAHGPQELFEITQAQAEAPGGPRAAREAGPEAVPEGLQEELEEAMREAMQQADPLLGAFNAFSA